MDAQLGVQNNDVLDISSIKIQHKFISEGRTNADVFHEEDYDPSIDKDSNDDDYIQKNDNIEYTIFDPYVETFLFGR